MSLLYRRNVLTNGQHYINTNVNSCLIYCRLRLL